MRCSQCRHENPAGARFCNACGARLTPDVVCAACGGPSPPESRFCNACGLALAARPPTAPARFASPQAYTPTHLAAKILASRPTLEGERKHVTVLFADIKGSLELLADRDPEEARALLDPVLERMMEAVHRYEGTVNQVLGDGIMALFGAPVAHEDHAVRACYAALRMLETVERYGDEAQRAQGIPVQIRVGLNSGEVVVRSIDNDLYTDYTAVGQTTHLAARMEQTAKPGTILLTVDTYRLAEGHVQARPLARVPVRGLATPVETYELTGARPGRSRLQAAAARGLSPFAGREREVAALRRALERAAGGHGQVLVLAGEPGVGKSRLLFEFTRGPWAAGWLILESSAVSYLRASPYLPVIELLTTYCQIAERDPPGTVAEKVTSRLRALDERLAAAVAPLLLLLDALPAEDPFRLAGPEERRGRTLDALRQLFLRESQRQPVLLVIENLHWLDTESQAFLDGLVESLTAARVLLLLSCRPGHAPGWSQKAYYTQLPIDPLTPDTADLVLRGLLGTDAALEPLKRLLIERTDGNPFFLEESVRTLIETGALEGVRGAYRLVRAPHAIRVPGTVQAVLAARIDRLPAAEKQLLQAAAVIGKDVPFPLLRAIADLPDDGLGASLAHLRAAEFLGEVRLFPDLELSFTHALTHEVAYGSLLHERRRQLHIRILQAIERLYADRLGEQVERLALHALRGESWDKALTYCRQAGARAAARSANAEAVTGLEQALGALAHLPKTEETARTAIDLRLDLWPPLLQLGRLDEVLAISRDAETLAADLGDEARLARVYTYLANYHYLKGEPDRAVEYGQRCLGLREAGRDLPLQALVRRYMGQSYHAQGQYALAEAVLEQNMALLDQARGTDLDAPTSISLAASSAWLAFALAERGEFARARAWAERARAVADGTRQAYGLAIAGTAAGLVAIRRGELAAAIAVLEESLAVCRDKHLAVWEPIPSSLLGLALAALGRPDAGLPLLEAGVALTEGLGINAYRALWTTQLAEGLLAAGQVAPAAAAAEQALALARAHRERGHEAWAELVRGDAATQTPGGVVEAAAECYQAALHLARQLGMRPLEARSRLALGRLYRRAGRRPPAEAHLTQATALLCELDMRLWVQEAWAELGALGHLVVVAQSNRALYDYLRAAFPGPQPLLVVLDRRRAERRRAPGRSARDRRRVERRRQAIEAELAARGLVIIAQPGPAAAGATPDAPASDAPLGR